MPGPAPQSPRPAEQAGDAAAAPRGWHRVVGWPALVGVSLFITAAWLTLMAAALWQLREHGIVKVAVPDQPVKLQLPAGLVAQADIHTPLDTRLLARQPLRMPLDQTVTVHMLERMNGRARVAANVPVRTSVEVATEARVDTTLDMQVPVVRWLPALTVAVPLAVSIPVRTRVPVDFEVPLVLDVALEARLDAALSVPVKTVLTSVVALDAPLTVNVLNRTQFTLQAPVPPFEVRVQDTAFTVALKDLGWTPVARLTAGSAKKAAD